MSMLARLRRFRQTLSRKTLRPIYSSHGDLAAASQRHPSEPLEEELLGDRLKQFHHTHPGQLLDGRFKTIAKLGFGAGSTVWLAENEEYHESTNSLVPRFVSIKIGALDADATKELTSSKLIANANPSHEGLAFLRTPVDDFRLQGPQGTHSCLVYRPMRESLFDFQHRIPTGWLPLPLFKFFVYCLLESLDYLHTECRVIHTDIKDDNIMVTIENQDVLEEFASSHTRNPPPEYPRPDGRVIYMSSGLAGGQGHLSPIQSHRFRAPEVLLGVPWSYSTDIWNLGLLMWNLLQDLSLFGRPAGPDGEYDAHVHLSQMITLLGPPPKELVKRERVYREHRLGTPLVNPRDKVCRNMNEFWGGPFFDDNGNMIRKDLLRGGPTLAETVTCLDGEERQVFLDFAGGMLRWLPEERKSAKQLLEHRFFDSFYEHRARIL